MSQIKDFILNWNYKFPMDRWWREKHGIAFNSPEHRISSFIDQFYEFEEDRLYRKLRESKPKYEPNNNDYLNIKNNKIENIEDGIDEALRELERFKKENGNE